MFISISEYQYTAVTSRTFSEKRWYSLFGPSYISKKTIAAVSTDGLVMNGMLLLLALITQTTLVTILLSICVRILQNL